MREKGTPWWCFVVLVRRSGKEDGEGSLIVAAECNNNFAMGLFWHIFKLLTFCVGLCVV